MTTNLMDSSNRNLFTSNFGNQNFKINITVPKSAGCGAFKGSRREAVPFRFKLLMAANIAAACGDIPPVCFQHHIAFFWCCQISLYVPL